mmetsp:Transcript_64182/g.186100  ORF Transcript_64182/g.186100 Transcript_64182/m.186100 type:complete len:242 (+) Transcript_64182:376-1101(+)
MSGSSKPRAAPAAVAGDRSLRNRVLRHHHLGMDPAVGAAGTAAAATPAGQRTTVGGQTIKATRLTAPPTSAEPFRSSGRLHDVLRLRGAAARGPVTAKPLPRAGSRHPDFPPQAGVIATSGLLGATTGSRMCGIAPRSATTVAAASAAVAGMCLARPASAKTSWQRGPVATSGNAARGVMLRESGSVAAAAAAAPASLRPAVVAADRGHSGIDASAVGTARPPQTRHPPSSREPRPAAARA